MTTATPTDADLAWKRLLGAIVPLLHGQVERWRELSEAEWEAFLRQCNLHWLTPFVCHALAETDIPAVAPPAVWCQFERLYRRSRARTRLADSILVPVLAAFNAERIPVLVLKGLHLSVQAYATPAARPMVDADVLVRPEHLPAAVRIIESFGFRQRNPGEQRIHATGCHLEPFWRPSGPPIELHYGLEARSVLPNIDLEGVWARASQVRMGSAEVLVLSPEDALLHLCMHAAAHHAFGIKLLNLCDIPVALERWRHDIDWPVLWQRAQAWNVERAVVITLTFARDRLHYPLPRAALGPIERYGPDLEPLLDIAEELIRRKADALVKKRKMDTGIVSRAELGQDLFFSLRALPTLRGRLALLLRRVFVPQAVLLEWFGFSSPRPWAFLLYPVRLALLSARYGPILAKLVVQRCIGTKDTPQVRQILDGKQQLDRLATWMNNDKASLDQG